MQRKHLQKLSSSLAKSVTVRLAMRVRKQYKDVKKDMTYQEFKQGELRYLRCPRDVRFIDSIYQNRDSAPMRREVMRLQK